MVQWTISSDERRSGARRSAPRGRDAASKASGFCQHGPLGRLARKRAGAAFPRSGPVWNLAQGGGERS